MGFAKGRHNLSDGFPSESNIKSHTVNCVTTMSARWTHTRSSMAVSRLQRGKDQRIRTWAGPFGPVLLPQALSGLQAALSALVE